MTYLLKKLSTTVFFTVFAFLLSCGGIKNAALQAQSESSNCNQETLYAYTPDEIPKPIHELSVDTILQGRLSFQSLQAANAIGILDIIDDLAILKRKQKNNPTLETRVEILEISQQISRKIDIASLEVMAVASELECEVERAEQISVFLKDKEDDTGTKLTVGAIIVGATAAAATGVLVAKQDNSGGIEIIGITAGITEATLGMLILKNERKVDFKHPRNFIRELQQAPMVSGLFPPSVWYYLNYENPTQPGVSLRKKLVDKWLEFGEVEKMKEKEKQAVLALFLGNGGKYNANQLAKRANMHDQIAAYINLMKQDLRLLSTELEKLGND